MFNKKFKVFIVIIFTLVILTLNITKVVSFTDNIKFNLALSDFLMPFFLILSLYLWKYHGFKKTYRHFIVWTLLLIWIIGVGFLAIQDQLILDDGWIGIGEELIKTGICIVYFFVGYNTLKVIKFNSFRWIWSFATLIFLIGGFIIYILATKGIYIWSEDPKYFLMFMGTDTDPNHAATYLTLTFFAMGIFATGYQSKLNKIYYYSIMALTVSGLIFTGSRGGLLGFALGIMVLLFCFAFKNWRVALFLGLVLLLMSIMFLIIDQYFLDSYFTQRLLYKMVDVEIGFDIRANLSKTAILMGIDHPLFGVGRGNYVLNSPKYFEYLGVDYVDNIPHNTYFGLFAETGLIGLVLFCMPFLLLIYAVYRRYRKHMSLFYEESTFIVWLCSALIALGAQAFVLNVENRRFLWYLAGILIFMFESEHIWIKSNIEKIRKGLLNIGLVFLIVCLITFSYFSISFIHIPHRGVAVNQNFSYTLPYENFIKGEPYSVGINLYVGINESLTERVELRVVEIRNDGTKVVLDSFDYSGANGIVVRTFTPSMKNSKIMIKAHKLDQSLSSFFINPTYLRDKEKIYELNNWYFLQSEALQRRTLLKNVKSYNNWVQKSDLTLGLSKTLGEKIKVKSVSIHQTDEFSTEVNVELQAVTEVIDTVYPFLYGFPNNLHLIPEHAFHNGAENYVLMYPVDERVWQPGESRSYTFYIPRQKGIYTIRLGAYQLINSELIYLNIDGAENPNAIFLELGWLNLDLFDKDLNFE